MSIQLSTADFEQIVKNADIETYRTDYSGRFMYGQTCIGIIGGNGELLRFAAEVTRYVQALRDLSDEGGETADEAVAIKAVADLSDQLAAVKSDNMGLDTIYYWPDVQAVA